MSWNQKLFDRHLQTRRFGRECVWFDELDSTNRWLSENLNAFTMSGGVVVCDHQLRGRGRFQRTWFDRPGSCLLFSVILRYPVVLHSAGMASLLPAIAIAECLVIRTGSKTHVSLKWPNDVLLNGRKAAGILGVNMSAERGTSSVVGVGFNLDLTEEDFPADIRETATSLKREAIAAAPREVLLAEILMKWEALFDEASAGNPRELCERWERFGPERGSRMVRSTGREKVEGYFAGLGDQGQMLLQTSDHGIIEIFSGDIDA